MGFERASRLPVETISVPWAAYREALVSRLLGQATIDVVAMSDVWLPEFAERGWLAPLEGMPAADEVAAETRPICNQAMTWKGHRYGMPYYTDSMAFLYNARMLGRAGIAAAPATWDEVVEQGQRLQRLGLVRHALGVPLAEDPWMIEVLTAIIYAFGGQSVDSEGRAMMADPERGAVPGISFIRDAMGRHGILSPEARNAAEADVLEEMAEGAHAFCLLPSYRLRTLNDASTSSVAGGVRAALMPRGGALGRHETCGWVRFFAATASAMANPGRRDAVEAFLPAIAGRGLGGAYAQQKRLLLEGGLPFCAQPLLFDPEVEAALDRWTGGSTAILRRQGTLSRPKDLISPWLTAWLHQSVQDLSNAFGNAASPERALGRAAERWMAMRAAHG